MQIPVVFSCLLAFNFILSSVLFPFPPSGSAFWFNVCWIQAGMGTCLLVMKKKKAATVLIAIALLGSVPTCLCLPRPQGISWLLQMTALLAYVWPLRFVGLGEFCLAWIFGPAFWSGYARLAVPAASPCDRLPFVMAGISAFSFFLSAFLANMNDYRRQKELQQFSLPVLLGNFFPALEKKWGKFPEKRKKQILWAGPAAYVLSTSIYLIGKSASIILL